MKSVACCLDRKLEFSRAKKDLSLLLSPGY